MVGKSSRTPHPSFLTPHPSPLVVLLGWYGSDNTGDEAVLEAIVGALTERGVTNLHALSIDPAKTAERIGISSSPRNPFSLSTLRAMRRSSVLILGGGGLIQDRTSVYNLPLYAFYVLLARLFGLRVIGWGLGVEPLDTLLGKLLARFICGASIHFSVRDAGSQRLLAKAGVRPENVIVSADPAFLIRTPSNQSAKKPNNQSSIVYCLRDLPNNQPGLNLQYLLPISVRQRLRIGGEVEMLRTERFVEAIAHSVALCVNSFGARVKFLPLWPGRDDKMIVTVMQAAERLGVSPGALQIIEAEPIASAIAAEIADADLLVSMRLHAMIFAANQGVPMLALAYARKMRGFMRLMGTESSLVEVETHDPSPTEIEQKLRQAWETRDENSKIVRDAAASARERANKDADTIAALLLS